MRTVYMHRSIVGMHSVQRQHCSGSALETCTLSIQLLVSIMRRKSSLPFIHNCPALLGEIDAHKLKRSIASQFCTAKPRLCMQLLLCHAVEGVFSSKDIRAFLGTGNAAAVALLPFAEVAQTGVTVLTTDGRSVTVSPAGTLVHAHLIMADIETCSGMLHVIDKVAMAPRFALLQAQYQ